MRPYQTKRPWSLGPPWMLKVRQGKRVGGNGIARAMPRTMGFGMVKLISAMLYGFDSGAGNDERQPPAANCVHCVSYPSLQPMNLGANAVLQ